MMNITATTASFLSDNTETWGAVACATTVVVGTWIWFRSSSSTPKRQRLCRNLSFTSAFMNMGTYPSQAKAPEDILHVCMYMESCPTDEDMVETAIQPMLVHDRFSMIPTRGDKTGTLRMPFPPLVPQKMMRRIQVTCTNHLHDTITELFQQPLGGDNNPRGDLPLWEFVLLENTGPGDSACIWRVHHTLGDGLSLAALMMRHVVKSSPDGAPMSSVATFLPPTMMSQKSSSLKEHATIPWTTRLWQLLDCALQVLLLPSTPFDDPTAFSKGFCQPNNIHSGKREIVLFPTVPLKLIQSIKNTARVSVNDVIVTCLSQAIHDYCQEQNCPVLKQKGPNLQCRVLVASALPRDVENANTEELLAVGYNNISERLQHIHNTFRRLKKSPLAHVGIWVQNHVLKYVPLAVNRKGVYDSMIRHSLVLSNVPGPQQPVMVANREIKSARVFYSGMNAHVMVMSYRGQVQANLTVDPQHVPNSQTLAKHYHQAILTLARRLDVAIPAEMEKIPL
ncbi:expressed unknown protein [Seminavis robusta]|uniref:Diacylglycerol O-acyltransferase n=1 Tax=Seminavis robusta TaxID=568900 RepID=A0A9N8E8K1_9STRA|nr:expressed unknown protein [Seminavis robusta]|eukprot:Sro740_g195630.1 n/a (508) ;mRNA; f:44761-46607